MSRELDVRCEPEIAPRAPDSAVPLVATAAPEAVLARVAADRADPRLALTLARAAGNRYVQDVAKRGLARKAAKEEPGTWIDPDNDPTYARIIPLLNRSPWGREALETLKAYKVKTHFATDNPPANFAQQLNRVRLNTSMRDDVLSAYFVHEMYHASQFHQGKSPGPSSHDDMGAWVRILVDEEIEGTARGYLHKLQLERTSPNAPRDDNPPWISAFRAAFDNGYRSAIQEGKDVDHARARGRAWGRRRTELLIRPEKDDHTEDTRAMGNLGPSEIMTYGDFYRGEWRRAHAGDAKPAQ